MPSQTIRVVVALVEREGTYLITQRREHAVLPLLWEFPGGRVEPGETDPQALAREMEERLGVGIEVDEKIGERHHDYEGYSVELVLYSARLIDDQLTPHKVRDFRWVASKDFCQYSFPPADQKTMDLLLGFGPGGTLS